ncbi:unnamed protein product [Vicia faba]|uniref:Uncharacterized protein n=1 Tax=Vicia faba TaxID=3906 RepID=A0AAV1BA09_VICFA|nr:unnamed protein product [Vicia faba]
MTISHGCYAGDDIPFGRSSSSHRVLDTESGHSALHVETQTVVLQEIPLKCGTKVEFTSSLAASREQFFIEDGWRVGKQLECMMEGLGVNFLSLPAPVSANSGQKDEVHIRLFIPLRGRKKRLGDILLRFQRKITILIRTDFKK